MTSPARACPCCGYRTLRSAPASYDDCEVCCWEEDGFHDDDALSLDGPNGMTLAEGQRLFARYGTTSPASDVRTRPPRADEAREPGWQAHPAPEGVPTVLVDHALRLEHRVFRARDVARRTRAPADLARFEALRETLLQLIAHVDDIGLPRHEAGLDDQLDVERDLELDPPPGRFAG